MSGDPTNPPPNDGAAANQVPTCRFCGCTDDRACEGGCDWLDFDGSVCSRCVGPGSVGVVMMVRQVAEGAKHAAEAQARGGDMAGAVGSSVIATVLAGLGELYAVCEAYRVEHAKIGAKRADPEQRTNPWCGPGEDEDCSYASDSFGIEAMPILNRLRELAIEIVPETPQSGLVDARGMPVSSPGGLAPAEGSQGGDPARRG